MPHIHEKLDFTVEVFVVNGDAVLLRKHDKYKIWLGVGGHIELGEEPTHAAVREVKEEVGLDITLMGDVQNLSDKDGYRELVPPRAMNIHPINDTHDHVSLIYFANAGTRDIIASATEKSAEIKWFTKDELDDPQYGIYETIRHYVKAALNALGKS